MSENKANISVCFYSKSQTLHFLFQALNIGKSTDELKFVFTDPESGVGGLYMQNPDRVVKGDLVRLVPEVSYHSDGSLLFKLPTYSKRTDTVYRNPQQPNYRRTPLSEIGRWEGFLIYTVYNYRACKKESISYPHILKIDPEWFDETSFECRFFLGNKQWPTPIEPQQFLVQRIDHLSDQLDLLLIFAKIKKNDYFLKIGNTEKKVWSTSNVMQIIPGNPRDNP